MLIDRISKGCRSDLQHEASVGWRTAPPTDDVFDEVVMRMINESEADKKHEIEDMLMETC